MKQYEVKFYNNAGYIVGTDCIEAKDKAEAYETARRLFGLCKAVGDDVRTCSMNEAGSERNYFVRW